MIEQTTVTVTIDEETYEIQMLDAVQGFRVYTKLLGVIGGMLGQAGTMQGSPQELGLKLMGSALQNLTPELAEELRSVFAKSCAVVIGDKKPQVKDVFLTHFRGRYFHMSKWLLECVKVNFSDFLAEGSSGGLSQILTQFRSPSPKP